MKIKEVERLGINGCMRYSKGMMKIDVDRINRNMSCKFT